MIFAVVRLIKKKPRQTNMEAITFSSHGRGQVDFPLFFHTEYKHLVLLSQDKQYKGQKKAALKVL